MPRLIAALLYLLVVSPAPTDEIPVNTSAASPEEILKGPPVSPTVAALKAIKEVDDLFDSNPLLSWMDDAVTYHFKTSYDATRIHMLEQHFPKKAGHYYAMFHTEGSWSNGGMQAVVLDIDHTKETLAMLKRTAEAFEHFGAKKTAAVLRELIPKTQTWHAALKKVLPDAPESAYEPIYNAVDAYDAKYEAAQKADPSPYDALLADIQKNPGNYVPKPLVQYQKKETRKTKE